MATTSTPLNSRIQFNFLNRNMQVIVVGVLILHTILLGHDHDLRK